jgi:putative transposase
MIVAMRIIEDGTKRILGLRQGATENAEVCVELLEDLHARGLNRGRPTFFVLDGSKALHAVTDHRFGSVLDHFEGSADSGEETKFLLENCK